MMSVEGIEAGEADWGVISEGFFCEGLETAENVPSKQMPGESIGDLRILKSEEDLHRAIHLQTESCLNKTQQAGLNSVLAITDPKKRDEALWDFLDQLEDEVFFNGTFESLPLAEQFKIFSEFRELAKNFTDFQLFASYTCFLIEGEIHSDPHRFYNGINEMITLIKNVENPIDRAYLLEYPLAILEAYQDVIGYLCRPDQIKEISSNFLGLTEQIELDLEQFA